MPESPPPPGPAFPPTRWSRILARPEGPDLEELARAYWRPIRAWLGARLRLGEDAAEELTQEAFAWLLERRLLDRADPQRGRFRAFLKTALSRFALQHARRAAAHKRGGGRLHESLEAAVHQPDPGAPAPDRILDEAWRAELLQGARDDLQRDLEASGRGTYFALFTDYFLAEGDLDHRGLARRYGITTTDVSNWLDYAKRRYRELLRARVRETVADEETLQEELQWLFGSGGKA